MAWRERQSPLRNGRCHSAADRVGSVMADGRPEAKEYLEIVDRILDDDNAEARPRATVVRGDLVITGGDKQGALKCCRQAAGMISDNADQGWAKAVGNTRIQMAMRATACYFPSEACSQSLSITPIIRTLSYLVLLQPWPTPT